MARSPPLAGDRTRSRRSRSPAPDASGRAGAAGGGEAVPAFPVVGVGASAGGLDACRKLLDALPAAPGMAFILVQHLDPSHESMMAELLAGHTAMPVLQARDGMPVERDHLYLIPPGASLAVADGALRLTAPIERHGARLPFDFLLHSLAAAYGPHAACIVLSGTGADGSAGLMAVRRAGGFVVAQDPAEAGYDGMPRSAIATGAVDAVLRVADMPAALARRRDGTGTDGGPTPRDTAVAPKDPVRAVVDLLRGRTPHDFSLYKPGTIERRIQRRMAMVAIEPSGMERYLALLRREPAELERLAKDLLINVTSFFRDSNVFALLATEVLPDLLRDHPADQALRIWIAGCSTGEEAYSLAILVREVTAAVQRSIKLQIFASDVDADAVATAREGLYPLAIEADVSPERLARFFTRGERGYRILPELRGEVVFAVQDLLVDPPFSRLDLVSCRNLLIYLSPEAQAKAIALFHFALRPGGILLLGNAESAGDLEGRFEVMSKPGRLYRRIGPARAAELRYAPADGVRAAVRPGQGPAPSRQAALAELCRRLVLDAWAPATVLIDRTQECLYALGPTDRYLQVPSGAPTRNLIAMARPEVRTKLRSAIQRAAQDQGRVDVEGSGFDIVVQPVPGQGEALLLVSFLDRPERAAQRSGPAAGPAPPRVAELERELEATRTELQGAIRSLETSNEDQKAINEEALSIQEEYQSTNEELLTSKEELQSLNEELTALNSQLHETLERQRTTSNDLQNVLYSTDVATIFLDTTLRIRFFTPATRSLFSVIPTDIGRPLTDLASLSADAGLTADARAVLQGATPPEREIEVPPGAWYVRRVLPYRTGDGGVEGVVITFTDITERRRVARALDEARQQAELASRAKSRFLATASHDLRQPLQALTLLQALLAKAVDGEKAVRLVARLGQALGGMSGMLNALLDINQIDAGTVHPDPVDFRIDELLARIPDAFGYQAQARQLDLRVVGCSAVLHTDPRLLDQMIRNLVGNALKYTPQGRVLVGCRRRPDAIVVEVWDTGVGIAAADLETIFEEYNQLDNAERDPGRGLGLGLAIVERLAALLGLRIAVRSQPGRGSVFAIEIPLPAGRPVASDPPDRPAAAPRPDDAAPRHGTILLIEDDPDVRELLALSLTDAGHQVAAAADGPAALALMAHGALRPDIILADYNLPHGMDGIAATAKIRETLRRPVPVIILTGDISTATLRRIAEDGCLQLNKPVDDAAMNEAIQRLLPAPDGRPLAEVPPAAVVVIDDDAAVRDTIRALLEGEGRAVEAFATAEAFLEAYVPGAAGCLLVDAALPGMSGLDLLKRLRDGGDRLPAIVITGGGDVRIAVEAMRAGASDFIEKPVGRAELLAGIDRALEQAHDAGRLAAWRRSAAALVAGLTGRQRQVMGLVLAGRASKGIAADLGISQRTVENHRAAIMRKTGTTSLPALARLALAAASDGSEGLRAP